MSGAATKYAYWTYRPEYVTGAMGEVIHERWFWERVGAGTYHTLLDRMAESPTDFEGYRVAIAEQRE